MLNVVRNFLLGGILVSCLASCPSSYTLGFPGEYPVASYEGRYADDLPLSIYYPDTNPRLENLPVVIITPAWNQPRASYAGYATQLAQWGFVAVIRFYPTPGLNSLGRDLEPVHILLSEELINWLGEENDRPESPLYRMVDTDNVGTTGHSFGGGVAIFHAAEDPRVKAMVTLDSAYRDASESPETRLANTAAAMMFIVSSEGGDCTIPPYIKDPVALFDVAPEPAAEVTIANSDHIDFMDSLIGAASLSRLACPNVEGPPSPDEIRKIASRYMIAWFNVHLRGDADSSKYYAGSEAQSDINDGLVSIRLKTK